MTLKESLDQMNYSDPEYSEDGAYLAYIDGANWMFKEMYKYLVGHNMGFIVTNTNLKRFREDMFDLLNI